MNVVDSSAWLSYFAGDNNADLFARPMQLIEELVVPTITITEVFKIILRQRNEDSALEAIAHNGAGGNGFPGQCFGSRCCMLWDRV